MDVVNDRDEKFYVTTPIYYVNDRPHIGHLYTTTVADIVARFYRLQGKTVFFLTGVDEHAAKVVDAATEHGVSPQAWADQNAAVFQETFTRLGTTHDDFIRTSQDRHKQRVTQYVRQLMAGGDVYAGQYEGWYDAGQEEYVPDNKAKEYDFKSPVNRKPLVRKQEKNYFFRLGRYANRLQKWIEEENPVFVQPEARRNEVLGRIREGLNDVPISRSGTGGWGIPIPDDPEQTIYVWIDALFNYLSTVDAEGRQRFWPADVHFIAKDILWFHAVIWPAMLMALDRPLPRMVYAHSYWISEGQKMSKSLGNFIDLERIDSYVDQLGLDALRYFLATEGPMGATDADFAHQRFIDVYNGELANALGNCLNRVVNMTGRYFDGRLPAPQADPGVLGQFGTEAAAAFVQGRGLASRQAMAKLDLHGAARHAMDIVRGVDTYIETHQPFKRIKESDGRDAVGTMLYTCAESLRHASIALWPIMPSKIETLWSALGCTAYQDALHDKGCGDLETWTSTWGVLNPGTAVALEGPLFPRAQG